MYNNYKELKNKLSKIVLGDYLEFGCGSGIFLDFVLKNAHAHKSITAVDINESVIEEAKTLLNNENIVFLNYSTLPLPFKNNHFDTITVSNALHHIKDKENVFKELTRIIKKDGNIIITEIISNNLSEEEKTHYYHHKLRVKIDSINNIFHEPAYTEDEIIHIIEKNNLKIKEKCVVKEFKPNTKVPEEIEFMNNFIDELISKIDIVSLIDELKSEGEIVKDRLLKYGIKRSPQVYLVIGK